MGARGHKLKILIYIYVYYLHVILPQLTIDIPIVFVALRYENYHLST